MSTQQLDFSFTGVKKYHDGQTFRQRTKRQY